MRPLEETCIEALETERQRSTGRRVDPRRIEQLKSHLASCEQCRAASALIRAGAADTSAETLQRLDDLARFRYIEHLLDKAAAGGSESAGRARHGRLKVAWVAAAVAALVAGAALLLVEADFGGAGSLPMAAVHRDTPAALPTAGAKRREGGAVFEENRLTVRNTPSVVSLPTGIELLIQPGGQMVIERADRTALEVRLIEGNLTATVDPERRGPRFRVRTSAGSVTVKGTEFGVQVSGESSIVHVLRGVVAVETPRGRHRVGAMEAFSMDRDAPLPFSEETRELISEQLASLAEVDSGAYMRVDLRNLLPDLAGVHLARAPNRSSSKKKIASTTSREVIPSVEELLSEAQHARRSRRWEECRRAYERLLRLHPEAGAAAHVRVPLGNLLLDRLHQPASALDHFDRYLALGEPSLAEEALFGKARALRMLGRKREEAAALREFVERFPRAMNVRVTRERLRALEEGAPLVDEEKK
jgi:tetratricopeptide (TPR) repeat protein